MKNVKNFINLLFLFKTKASSLFLSRTFWEPSYYYYNHLGFRPEKFQINASIIDKIHTVKVMVKHKDLI